VHRRRRRAQQLQCILQVSSPQRHRGACKFSLPEAAASDGEGDRLRLVVISRAFFLISPCNHIINKKKSFSGEVKDSVNFPPFFLLHKLHNPILPPYLPSRLPARRVSGSIESLTLQNIYSPLPSPSTDPPPIPPPTHPPIPHSPPTHPRELKPHPPARRAFKPKVL
jgi:hypothetical protein